ncbi:hypothetical protein BGZ97_009577, partial [Linnemannia gamsii]
YQAKQGEGGARRGSTSSMPTPPSEDNLNERLQSRSSSVPILQTRSIYDAFSPSDKGHTSTPANLPPLPSDALASQARAVSNTSFNKGKKRARSNQSD